MRQSKPNRRNIVVGKLTYKYDIGKSVVQLWHPNGRKEIIQKHKFPSTTYYGHCSCGSYGCDYNPETSSGIRPSDVRKYIELNK